MTTIKTKFRPSRVAGKKGSVFYQISHHQKIRQITTPIRIYPEAWDFENERIFKEADEELGYQQEIDNDIAFLTQIVERMDCMEMGYDVSDIVQCYRQTQYRKYVLAFMKEESDYLRARNRLVTAINYDRARSSFAAYLEGRDITFTMMNESLVCDYEVYLIKRGLVRNSISFYMRILRAVYNRAVKKHWVVQSHPFDNVYTGIDRTQKRAISENWISKMYKIILPENSAIELARDLFIFSYCTRGMAFVDMANLKKSNIKHGCIWYSRHKTSQPLCIRIESEIKRLIDKYKRKTPDTPYIFPILQGDDALLDFKRYHIGLNNYNRLLKKLAGEVGMECNLTSYVARHSWATSARNHHIPISVISAGLGHESEKTTEIYLKRLENSLVDSANLEIIRQLLK